MKVLGTALCTSAMVILGSSVPISRALLSYPTLAGQVLRYTLAVVILLVIARRLPRLRLRSGVRLVVLAAVGLVGFNVCLLAALREAEPAVVGTVVGGTPVVLALIGPLLARRRPALRITVGAAVIVAGVALVQGAGHASTAGLLWSAGTLAGEVGFSLLAAPLLAELTPIAIATYACLFAVPLLLVASVAAGETWRVPTWPETGALLYLAVVLTALAFVLWYGGLARLGVEKAGMFAGLLPVAALAATAVLDGTVPSAGAMAGTVLVAAGLAFGLSAPATGRAAHAEPADRAAHPELAPDSAGHSGAAPTPVADRAVPVAAATRAQGDEVGVVRGGAVPVEVSCPG
ncbi:EamA family transporter [Longispora urticae]